MNTPVNKPSINVNYNNSSYSREYQFEKKPLANIPFEGHPPAYSPYNYFRPPRLAPKVNTLTRKNKSKNKNKNKNPLMMTLENAFDSPSSVNSNIVPENERPTVNVNAPQVRYQQAYNKPPLIKYKKNLPQRATARSPVNFFGLEPSFYNKYFGAVSNNSSNNNYNGTNSYFPISNNVNSPSPKRPLTVNEFNLNSPTGGRRKKTRKNRKTRKSKRSSSLSGRR